MQAPLSPVQSEVTEKVSVTKLSDRSTPVQDESAVSDRPISALSPDTPPNKCKKCGYVSGEIFTKKGKGRGDKQQWRCPSCGAKSTGHLYVEETPSTWEQKTSEFLDGMQWEK